MCDKKGNYFEFSTHKYGLKIKIKQRYVTVLRLTSLHVPIMLKCESMFVLVHTMKACRGSSCITPLILKLDVR